MTRPLLGVTLPQFSGVPGVLVAAARQAEEAGLDSVWLFDHLWPLGGAASRDTPIVEAWTALSYLAAATERVSVGTLVTRSSLRHPAMVAKMAATASAIAPGRVVVGLGSGDELSKAENEAFGAPYWAAPERVAQLSSTLDVVRAYLHGRAVSQRDGFVEIVDLPPSPVPEPPPALWVGGSSRDIVTLAARKGDAWNAWAMPPDRFARAVADLGRLAGSRAVQPTWGGGVVLGRSNGDARDRLGDRNPAGWVTGGPEAVAAHLNLLVSAGAEHLIASLPIPGDPALLELLGGEVKPALADVAPDRP
jgi:alkanesulfonate monooxygenase SsuD/methylene tetrahydromethanopterin reductase-like flavin-dependent oxidoreductase (luciferase family)